MHAEDRLIHFSTELIHAPTRHNKPQLQKLYFELAQARVGYDNSELTDPAQAKFYSRRGERSQSLALFLPDRIALVEEWADISLSEFLTKTRTISEHLIASLGIPTFTLQVVTLRSTFALTHFTDARVFLLERVCGQRDRIGPHFRRPIAIGGLRFVMPPVPGHRGDLHVAVESFRHNPAEILVEVKALYADAIITAESLDSVTANIASARSFITDSIFPYLDQYDVPVEDFGEP